jgi:hypothetical protein
MTDRITKRDRRDAQRRKRRPVHGRSLVHVLAAIAKRAQAARLRLPTSLEGCDERHYGGGAT